MITGMGENNFPVEIDVGSAAEEWKKGATLLDVREPMERQVCKISGSLEIPMGQVPQALSQLSKDGCLLVLCHHGIRSAQVTHYLRNQGFENAVNVAGGIDAWAEAVDPQMNRY